MATVRLDAPLKVSGQAQYTADIDAPPQLYAAYAVAGVGHGVLHAVHTHEAERLDGVRAVICGRASLPLTGILLEDRPILATGRVRYAGEPIALVVADTQQQAEAAALLITADITPLPVVNALDEALRAGAALLHPELAGYAKLVEDVYPQPGTNIASSYRISKGDSSTAFSQCVVVVEHTYHLPQSDHIALEPRCSSALFLADGRLKIRSSTQAPYTVRWLVAKALGLEMGKVEVETPFLGGAFGGKTPVFLEYLAALAARKFPGFTIKLENSRGRDMASSPSRLALEAVIRLGADVNGKILAARMEYLLDCGAYCDIAPNMAKAIAVDCSGPYNIENLYCDSLCVYTNHTYATSFRGFAHESYTFCLERTLDALADALHMDKLQLREINAIGPGDFTPTMVKANASNLGNVAACINSLRSQLDWQAGERVQLENGLIRAKGVSLLWKTPNPSLRASAGAVLTFNGDGSANLNVGVVEMGNGGKETLALLAAQRLRMAAGRVHVSFSVDTKLTPEYWKTVASLSSFLAGKAVIAACDDALRQLISQAAIVLRCSEEDLDYGQEKVFFKGEPDFCVGYQDLVSGVILSGGNSVGGQIIGRGSHVMRHTGPLAKDTGKGRTGHSWTVGAQGVEVEYDPKDHSYRLLRACTSMDIGAVQDFDAAVAMIRGGMSMGLSLARNEEYIYDEGARLLTASLRNYELLRIGEEPAYDVALITTPQADAPGGMRVFSEHGVIGMPAALANALSCAAGVSLDMLPLTPESIWYALGQEGAL